MNACNIKLDGGYDFVDNLLCLRQQVKTTTPKSAFWGIYDFAVTLTLDLLTPKFNMFILSP